MIIYALKLLDDNYWIGRTNNLNNAWFFHWNIGNNWTQAYRPICVIEKLESKDKYDEDKMVLRYMEKYGIFNVRGGSFTDFTLKPFMRKYILLQIRNANRFLIPDIDLPELDEIPKLDDKSKSDGLTIGDVNYTKCQCCNKVNCTRIYCPERKFTEEVVNPFVFKNKPVLKKI